MLDKSEYLVEYENEKYINEELLLQILKKAEELEKDRAKVYELNEPVEFYSNSINKTTVYIEKVMYTEKINGVQIDDSEWACVFTAKVGEDENIDVFSYFFEIELSDGAKYSSFYKVDKNTVAINIPKDTEGCYVYVESSIYGDDIRKIKLF